IEMKALLYLILLYILFLSGCEKVDKSQILGNWINEIDHLDTLFIGDTEINRINKNTLKPDHFYKYSISGDNITIKYLGVYAIEVPESIFNIKFEDERFTIKDFSTYFPRYEGDTFIKQH
ncbi:hypothetical protein ACFLSP_01100, partial [Bacteroidota bacterium]